MSHIDQNPWSNLRLDERYILTEDETVIRRNSHRFIGDYELHPELLPVPFLGDPHKATMLLLALNPGYKDEDLPWQQSNKDFVDQHILGLTFQSRTPFYYLDLAFAGGGGYPWWYHRLRELIQIYGHDTITQKIMVVQFFPYHSKRYKPLNAPLPSQEFNFTIVQSAIKNRIPIVVMRSFGQWCNVVSELQIASPIILKYPRTPYLKSNHMEPNEYQKLIKAIASSGPTIW